MQEAYANMPETYWKEHHIRTLIEQFPEGQVGIKIDNELATIPCPISLEIELFGYLRVVQVI